MKYVFLSKGHDIDSDVWTDFTIDGFAATYWHEDGKLVIRPKMAVIYAINGIERAIREWRIAG